MRQTVVLCCLLLALVLVSAPTAAQTDSPPPAATPTETTYTVQRGDTLYAIAQRTGTTVRALVEANNLGNANRIFPGQQLIIPGVPPPSVESQPSVPPPPVSFGVEAVIDAANVEPVILQAQEIGATWVKLDVDWREAEPEPGDYRLDDLDTVVAGLNSANISILLTVSSAPAWARTSTDESGPPDSLADFALFARHVAERYGDRVQAYQIWHEPNLRREWNSTVHPISASVYAELLRLSYEAINAGDPAALVISAGLAPTGFNDGVNAINDRIYLRDLYANGLANISDGVAAHPAGFANPPDSRCCDQPAGVETHFQDRSFFFLDTLTDYREIMLQNGDGDTGLWVTKFGWGSSEDTQPPSSINIFYTYTSLGEQAVYTPRALDLAAELGYVRAMFLSNLNGCIARPDSLESCYTSLIGPDGLPRPAYDALVSRAEGNQED